MRVDELFLNEYQGKVFQTLSKIEDRETEVDGGMRFRILAVNPMGYDDVFRVTLDGSDFVEHNDSKMQANYWDRNGNPCLTARQANMWPSNNRIDLYFQGDDDFYSYFGEVQ